MLKIKIEDIDLHRNECLFRPFLMNAGLFRDIGIEFVFDGNRYDMVWIGQASYMDKTKPYNQSIQNGIDYINKFKGLTA